MAKLLNWAKSRVFSGSDTMPRCVMSSSFRSFDRRIPSRKTLLACVAGSNLIVPAEFPSLTLGTAKSKNFGNPQRREGEEEANRPDLPDLPVKDPVKIAK